MPPGPTEKLDNLPFVNILLIPLDYFRPALVEQGISLWAGDARQVAEALAAGRRRGKAEQVIAALADIVDAQLALLQDRWGLDLASALRAEMSAIGTWRTTAEYIELANIKAEAESQIVLGAALLVAAGRHEYADCLIDALEYDSGESDVDTAIARRALLHASGVDGGRADWLAQVKRWLASASR